MEPFSTETVPKKRSRSKMRTEAAERGTDTVYKEPETEDVPEEYINDTKNIALLFFLYLLQGVPLGLAAAIPIILQNRHVSYSEQVCHIVKLTIAIIEKI